MQCVILAGGMGTRMAGVTGPKIPKALIPVNGTPFVRYQIEWLKRCQVTRITFCLGHLSEEIQTYVRSLGDQGVEIDFVIEREGLRGTAGALRYALELGRLEEKFLLLYGDSYLPLDAHAVWQSFLKSEAPALITVFKNHGKFDKSNTHYAEGRVLFYSKIRSYTSPLEYIDYGLSGLSRELIHERVPSGEKFDLAQIFEELSVAGQLAGFEAFERFYEIGSPRGLEEFTEYAREHLSVLSTQE